MVALFPDTNLFIQCRALEEIDWSVLSAFSEVDLIVSRPVQREIDSQKNRGNDRVGRRARSVNQLFRRVLESEDGRTVVRKAAPRVTLCLAGPGKPSAAASDILDYSKPDDEIVGHICEYRERYPARDARLLTGDSGQMMTAKALDVRYVPIPDAWRLDPEPSKVEKENQRLRARIAELEAGPQVGVAFVDDADHVITEITGVHRFYRPLSEEELDGLVRLLDETLPNFYFPRLSRRSFQAWKDRCRGILAGLHQELQEALGGIPFSVRARNEGTRPARHALIEVAARGHLSVRPDLKGIEGVDADLIAATLSLPSPPAFELGLNSLTLRLRSLRKGGDEDERVLDAFYFRDGPPPRPVMSYALECEQWRHQAGTEHVRGEVFLGMGGEDIKGAVECVIHADNLPAPVRVVAAVRVAVEPLTTFDRARAMVLEVAEREHPDHGRRRS